MTTKTTKGTKPAAKKSKRLSLSKQTVKDLRVRDCNPKGGRARVATLFGCCTLKNILTC